MDDLGVAVNQVTKDVAAKFAALDDPEFTVVVQPAVENVPLATFAKDDVEDLLSDVDCFHPSLCTDQAFAVGQISNLDLSLTLILTNHTSHRSVFGTTCFNHQTTRAQH